MTQETWPEKYRDKLFLTPKDLMEIIGFGENLAYEFLKKPPFRIQRVGAKIMIFSNSFWDWYNNGAA